MLAAIWEMTQLAARRRRLKIGHPGVCDLVMARRAGAIEQSHARYRRVDDLMYGENEEEISEDVWDRVNGEEQERGGYFF